MHCSCAIIFSYGGGFQGTLGLSLLALGWRKVLSFHWVIAIYYFTYKYKHHVIGDLIVKNLDKWPNCWMWISLVGLDFTMLIGMYPPSNGKSWKKWNCEFPKNKNPLQLLEVSWTWCNLYSHLSNYHIGC